MGVRARASETVGTPPRGTPSPRAPGKEIACYFSFFVYIRVTLGVQRAQENFHRWPQFVHSQKTVMGSSALRVWACEYATFFCLHLPHWNSCEILFSTCATMASFMFFSSSLSSSARRSSDFISSCVMTANFLGVMSPDTTRLRRLGFDFALRFWNSERILSLYASLTLPALA
jgi:hypothetical protein